MHREDAQAALESRATVLGSLEQWSSLAALDQAVAFSTVVKNKSGAKNGTVKNVVKKRCGKM